MRRFAIGLLTGGVAVWSMPLAAQRIERDVAYGAFPEQRLDLFLPESTGFPTVVFLHGGSLTSGDKADDDSRTVCHPFPAAGIGCVSVNYRLAPAAMWPAQPEDAAAAVRWVHDHIATRGGDPGRLVLFGHSSGAMLAALLGTDRRFLEQRGVPAASVRGVIPMGSIMYDRDLERALGDGARERIAGEFASHRGYGVFGTLEGYLAAWPISHVRPGMPPFLFLIAEEEQEQPPVLETNQRFLARARAAGTEGELQVLAGRSHFSAIRLFGEPDDPAFALVVSFVRRVTSKGQD